MAVQPHVEALLGSAKSARGQVNMLVLLVAFVLSIMVIDTRRKCDSKDQEKYNNSTQISFFIALVVVVLTCLLFAYDLAIIFEFIK
jgi:heme/copper-type cytochrome/quinol oxidase subunit 2